MKRIISIAMTAVLALTLGAGAAFAGGPGVKDRQVRQQKRIRHGVKNGSLTARETVRIQRNAAHIHRSTRRDRVDGGAFTARERVKSQKKLNKQSRAIKRQKHDGQRR